MDQFKQLQAELLGRIHEYSSLDIPDRNRKEEVLAEMLVVIEAYRRLTTLLKEHQERIEVGRNGRG